ncbi:MAG: tetratricopeptide repeat protein, partial [Bacteroidales bacterium]|nr:tetratricopeptide repeat protein [Bacteroidales bacterium]
MLKISMILLLICFVKPGLYAQDQNYIDSLVQSLKYSPHDTVKINLLNKIAADIVYVNSDKIYDYAHEALQLSEELNFRKGIAESYNNLGIYYRIKGIYEMSIDYFFNSLTIMEELNDKSGIARCYNLIGIIYYRLNNYDLSLKYYNKALDINLEQGDKKWIAGNYNNVGMIYQKKGNTDKALDYFFKSLGISIEIDNKNWIANNYGNIGILYQQKGNPKSIDYYFKRLEIKEEQNDIVGIVSTNNLIGKYYNSLKKYD